MRVQGVNLISYHGDSGALLATTNEMGFLKYFNLHLLTDDLWTSPRNLFQSSCFTCTLRKSPQL